MRAKRRRRALRLLRKPRRMRRWKVCDGQHKDQEPPGSSICRLTPALRSAYTAQTVRTALRGSGDGRVAQRESTAFTRQGSQVQSLSRPPCYSTEIVVAFAFWAHSRTLRFQLLSHSGHSKGLIMATIRKRNDRWQVQVRRQGFAPVARSFRLRTDAQEWAREMERQADRNDLPQLQDTLSDLSLGDLVKRYRDFVVPEKKGAEVEIIVLNAFLREPICKRPLSKLTPSDFIQYRNSRLKCVQSSTLRRQLNPIRHMFQIAINEWGIPLKENPLDKVTLKAKDNRRERRLKDGEYEKLLAAARTRQNLFIEKIIILAIETGMRRGEILNLCWDQVDLKRRSVTILESKNGYSRTIPITQLATITLQALPRDDARVFPTTANALRLSWDRMLEGTGIEDLHFHDLRHEAISRFFEMGLTVPEVASISGHRDTRMLLRYAHSDIKRVQVKLEQGQSVHQVQI